MNKEICYVSITNKVSRFGGEFCSTYRLAIISLLRKKGTGKLKFFTTRSNHIINDC
jgi:hypothetical protein